MRDVKRPHIELRPAAQHCKNFTTHEAPRPPPMMDPSGCQCPPPVPPSPRQHLTLTLVFPKMNAWKILIAPPEAPDPPAPPEFPAPSPAQAPSWEVEDFPNRLAKPRTQITLRARHEMHRVHGATAARSRFTKAPWAFPHRTCAAGFVTGTCKKVGGVHAGYVGEKS